MLVLPRPFCIIKLSLKFLALLVVENGCQARRRGPACQGTALVRLAHVFLVHSGASWRRKLLHVVVVIVPGLGRGAEATLARCLVEIAEHDVLFFRVLPNRLNFMNRVTDARNDFAFSICDGLATLLHVGRKILETLDV